MKDKVMTITEFVTEKGGFVNPEKITAIDLYGFEKAQEMWKDGKPDEKNLHKLRIVSCENALEGRKCLNQLHFI